MSKNLRRLSVVAALATLVVALLVVGQGMAQTEATIETLGERLYFDQNLSDCSLVQSGEVCNPDGQSCASCHEPGFGFVDPDKGLPVSEGVIFGRFGGRNSPASAYAMYAPIRYQDSEGLWIGGQFWDSRATGEVLGDPLADQALGPFLADVEMANPDKATVIADVAASDYADLFEAVWGLGSLDDVEMAYNRVALSIAAFERTPLFAQFSSKYDHYLQACMTAGGNKDDCAQGIGSVAVVVGPNFFTKKEWQGMQLFMNETPGEGAMCVLCHVADWTPAADNVVVPDWAPDDPPPDDWPEGETFYGWVPPLFTDFSYDNLGVPKNPKIEALIGAPQEVDNGLGSVVGPAENGKFKVMTLRNIHLTAPYAHNGLFKKLEDITHFYNTRDFLALCDTVKKPKPGENCWPAPEVPDTINVEELGNLGLSDADEDALVKFMKTLTDGWVP
jgi:cytochrome c peroxidase